MWHTALTEFNFMLCSMKLAALLEHRRRKAQKSPGCNLNSADKEACSSVLSLIRFRRTVINPPYMLSLSLTFSLPLFLFPPSLFLTVPIGSKKRHVIFRHVCPCYLPCSFQRLGELVAGCCLCDLPVALPRTFLWKVLFALDLWTGCHFVPYIQVYMQAFVC